MATNQYITQPRIRVLTPGQTLHRSEVALVNEMRKQGIYAISGTRTHFKYVDVVAWGCVRVESKWSSIYKDGHFHFRVKSWRLDDETIRGDVIVLACAHTPVNVTYHVFPSDHPVFFYNGHLKKGLNWTPGSQGRTDNRYGLSLNDALMSEHKGAWHLIETKRQEISQRLVSGVFAETVEKIEMPIAA